ncbi:MAG: L-rhamnose mutarotase, partial [Flavobacteriaceae bacterium]
MYFKLQIVLNQFLKIMIRNAFVMQLKKGCEAEYKKRHDTIWPELKSLLIQSG